MRNRRTIFTGVVVALVLGFFLITSIASGGEPIPKPKDFGVYAKTNKGLKRILPNIVSDEEGIYFLQPNNPQRFPLGAIDYFLVYGDYEIQYITLNPMKPFQASPVGALRAMFGKDIEITLTKQAEAFYTVKPKGLFGRGYYAIWINDTAWDFIVD
jgi:hypothetical protein